MRCGDYAGSLPYSISSLIPPKEPLSVFSSRYGNYLVCQILQDLPELSELVCSSLLYAVDVNQWHDVIKSVEAFADTDVSYCCSQAAANSRAFLFLSA